MCVAFVCLLLVGGGGYVGVVVDEGGVTAFARARS